MITGPVPQVTEPVFENMFFYLAFLNKRYNNQDSLECASFWQKVGVDGSGGEGVKNYFGG